MTYLPSLPAGARLFDVLKAYPETARPLLEYHDVLLRGRSPLTVAQRGLIAAYVSLLDACGYCHGIHAGVAERFGIPEAALLGLLEDLETAEIDDEMRPLLAYVRTLTLSPSQITPSAAEAVLAAGWSEHALHDAVAVCALFNFMNRYVDGLGVAADGDYTTRSADRLTEIGYAGLRDLLEY